ncbi:MAG: hypothetical protein EBR73_17005 [Rhodobacteraceae bacterium]|nr:hypothetical protein [Paracoccaceae bacterium]
MIYIYRIAYTEVMRSSVVKLSKSCNIRVSCKTIIVIIPKNLMKTIFYWIRLKLMIYISLIIQCLSLK